MKTSISHSYTFEAAHFLPFVPETHKCHNMHGHNYRIVITLVGEPDERGFVKDFAEIDEVVLPALRQLDHAVLNDTIENPTAEVIAAWLLQRVPCANTIRVYENEMSWADVRRADQ
jgi:6-pyruvoyltetrahydropterin/6-carboxytetrahydropterin synthase